MTTNFVIESKKGVLVVHIKQRFCSFYCYNCDHEFGIFCCEWTVNFRIFGHENFTSLVMKADLHSDNRE